MLQVGQSFVAGYIRGEGAKCIRPFWDIYPKYTWSFTAGIVSRSVDPSRVAGLGQLIYIYIIIIIIIIIINYYIIVYNIMFCFIPVTNCIKQLIYIH